MQKEQFQGLQTPGITTKGYLSMPEQAFRDASKVSEHLSSTVNVEVYPFQMELSFLNKLPRIGTYVPSRITSEKIISWLEEHEGVAISRLHLPFVYDWGDALVRWEGEPKQLRHGVWPLAFGLAKHRIDELSNMAKRIEDKQQKPVALSGHANIWAGFATEYMLDEVKNKRKTQQQTLEQEVIPLVTESAGRNKSSVIFDEEILADPERTAEFNNRSAIGIDGLIIGLDHAVAENFDIRPALESLLVRRQTRAVHIDINHLDVIGVGNPVFLKAFEAIQQTQFAHAVEATVEGDPKKFRIMSPRERQEVTLIAFEKLLQK